MLHVTHTIRFLHLWERLQPHTPRRASPGRCTFEMPSGSLVGANSTVTTLAAPALGPIEQICVNGSVEAVAIAREQWFAGSFVVTAFFGRLHMQYGYEPSLTVGLHPAYSPSKYFRSGKDNISWPTSRSQKDKKQIATLFLFLQKPLQISAY